MPIPERAREAADGLAYAMAGAAVASTWLDILAAWMSIAAAGFSVLWFMIRIWESKTVKCLVERWRRK